MPKYLIAGSYTAEGLAGLLKDGASNRRQAITSTIESAGGRLEAMYYALGSEDVYLIVDLPSHVKAAAVALTASASGLVRTKTTALLTIEETDQALSEKPTYRPPGR